MGEASSIKSDVKKTPVKRKRESIFDKESSEDDSPLKVKKKKKRRTKLDSSSSEDMSDTPTTESVKPEHAQEEVKPAAEGEKPAEVKDQEMVAAEAPTQRAQETKDNVKEDGKSTKEKILKKFDKYKHVPKPLYKDVRKYWDADDREIEVKKENKVKKEVEVTKENNKKTTP